MKKMPCLYQCISSIDMLHFWWRCTSCKLL